jgi:transposase
MRALVTICTELSNQIRGLMKTFGLVISSGKGATFGNNVRMLLDGHQPLSRIILPLLKAWYGTREQAAELSRQLIAIARASQSCRLLMSVPGVGVVNAASFVTVIEDPASFRRSRSVGAWLGLTTRRYQSGEVDYDGHISRRGDAHLRGLLFEAATVILTRSSADSGLRSWGLKLRERLGFKRAAVAVGSVSRFLKYRHKRRERLCAFSAFNYPVSCHVFRAGGIAARIGNGSAKKAPGIAQLRIRLTRLGKSFLEDWTRYSPLLFQAA